MTPEQLEATLKHLTWAGYGEQAAALREYIASARDAALDEAAARVDDVACKYSKGSLTYALLFDVASIIRALTSTPAARFIPEAKVLEVLRRARANDCGGDEGPSFHRGKDQTVDVIRADLGVDLDAKAGVYDEPAPPPSPDGMCPGCDAPADAPREHHRFSCTVHGKKALRLPAVTRERCSCGRHRYHSPAADCHG